MIANYPDAQGVLTDKQHSWTTALEQRTSVDPTLFGYQMRMNDSEAGAEKLLASFDSPDNVVRFFVAALNDQHELETFTGKLEAYSGLAAQRSELEAVAGFGAEIAPMIDLVAGRAADVDVATARSQRVRARGGEHAAALDNRINEDRESLAELGKGLEIAKAEANKARHAYGQISDIRQQLQLEEARARIAKTTEDLELAETEASKARRHEQAWQAVDVVIDLKTAREERDAARLAYKAADAGLEPLRARVAEAAAQTAGRLDALISDVAHAAETADAAAQEATELAEHARQQGVEATVELDRIKHELAAIKDQNDKADHARSAAVTAGWLVDGENPAACVRRWQDARGEAAQAAGRVDATATAADQAYDSLGTEIDTRDQQLIGLRAPFAVRRSPSHSRWAGRALFDQAGWDDAFDLNNYGASAYQRRRV